MAPGVVVTLRLFPLVSRSVYTEPAKMKLCTLKMSVVTTYIGFVIPVAVNFTCLTVFGNAPVKVIIRVVDW